MRTYHAALEGLRAELACSRDALAPLGETHDMDVLDAILALSEDAMHELEQLENGR